MTRTRHLLPTLLAILAAACSQQAEPESESLAFMAPPLPPAVAVPRAPFFAPPFAHDDQYTLDEDGSVLADVLINDVQTQLATDPNSIVVVAAPEHGTAAPNANGLVQYTPDADYNGTDSFQYTVDNIAGQTSNTASCVILVRPVCDAPTANDDIATTDTNGSVVIDFTSNDSDPDGPVQVASLQFISSPAGGVATFDPVTEALVYQANLGYQGDDTFSCQYIDDCGADSNPFDVTVHVIVMEPPSNLSYSDNPAVYDEGLEITPNLPSYDGDLADSFTVTPALPAGLSLDPITGVINGAPTANPLPDPAFYSVIASNQAGSTLPCDVLIGFTEAASPPSGLAYSQDPAIYVVGFEIAPNTPSYGGVATSWSVSPALPAGLALDSSTGIISGTPTVESGTNDYSITASNTQGGDSIDLAISVELPPPPPSDLSYSDNPVYYDEGVAISPNIPSYTGLVDSFSIEPPLDSLGLSLDPLTGVITGTPLIPTNGWQTFAVDAGNISGDDNTLLLIHVRAATEPPSDLSYSENPAVYLTGHEITPNTPAVTGGVTSFTVDVPLPAGLLLDPITGVISGTPSAAASLAPYTITASNSQGGTQETLALEATDLEPPSDLTYAVNPCTYWLDSEISPNTASWVGTVDSFTEDPYLPLPPGLELDPLTGSITGTPIGAANEVDARIWCHNIAGSDYEDVEIITIAEGSTTSLDYVSNGFNLLLPHKTFVLDVLTGQPTTQLLDIRTEDDLINNVTLSNPILAGPVFEETAVLPNGVEGNQFLHARFASSIDVDSVLSDIPSGQASGGLTGSIRVLYVNPDTGEVTQVTGRSFVGGLTYSGGPSGNPPRMELEAWVTAGELGIEVNPNVDNDNDGTPDGLGFPGVLSNFPGTADLVLPESFVFIPDTDSNLATFETFPTGGQILMVMETSVLSTYGQPLNQKAVACSTVGPDHFNPEVVFTLPPLSSMYTAPQDGEQNVDPTTNVRIWFTESIQPVTLGDLPTYGAPNLSSAVSIQFGPATRRVDVPFTVMPASPYNLTEYVLEPAFSFPGEGPGGNSCGAFDVVDISVNAEQFQDLAQIDVDGNGSFDRGNLNTLSGLATFQTGEGPGLVNVPVTPDAIYVGRAGATPGLSVVDLNGFGQSTGNPIYDDSFNSFDRGNSNFPNNPNVKLQGSLLKPALVPGECTVDGGSAGVFTLTLDSNLNDVLARAPLITTAGDMMLGHALDSSFNNAPAPYGCQSGGGNLCAGDGLKIISVILGGPNTITPPRVITPPPPPLNNINGGENIVSWAPHPNPPSISFPPLCVWPFLGTEEPTSIDVTFPPDPAVPALNNWLAPGDPFGDPNGDLVGIPTPPQGLLTSEQNAWFDGPPLPQLAISGCQQYKIRQQVGNFLYLLDRDRAEVVVLNSNRMNVIDRIIVPDPTELAISPNLDLLAVSNQSVDLVSFIDIDPASASFHNIVHQTVVGDGPRGIAWEPGNEDILVCNEAGASVSIISAFSLEVRKVVNSNLSEPFAIAITPRQASFGFFRNVYFAYIVNRDGRIAIFESGPNEINGWGYDDVIGTAPQTFQSPKTIQPDYTFLQSGVWICHEGPIDVQDQTAGSPNVPAVSNLIINSGISGILPLNVTSLAIPQFRDMDLTVRVSLGPESLTGIPVDLAFDNLRNYGGLPNFFTVFSAGVPNPLNGKSLVRNAGTNGPQGTNQCRYMFVAVPNPTTGPNGNIDVIDISGAYVRFDTNAHETGVQSIPVEGVTVLMDYFRQ